MRFRYTSTEAPYTGDLLPRAFPEAALNCQPFDLPCAQLRGYRRGGASRAPRHRANQSERSDVDHAEGISSAIGFKLIPFLL